MSNTTKIIIGVAVIALLAYGVYWYLTQPKTPIINPQNQQFGANGSQSMVYSTDTVEDPRSLPAGVPTWSTLFS